MRRIELGALTCVTIFAAACFGAAPFTAKAQDGGPEVPEDIQELEAIEEAELREEGPPLIDVRLLEGGLDLVASYHSNPYYRDADGEEAGSVFHIDPSIRIAVPFSEFLYFGAYAKINFTTVLLDSSGDSSEDDKSVLHPYVSADLRYSPTEFTAIMLSDNYQRANVEDDLAGDKYHLNQATAAISHEFNNSLAARIWYRNTFLEEDSGSLLFDYVENAVGAGVAYILTRTDAGRNVTASLTAAGGEKEFEEGSFMGQETDTNPKTHSFLTARVGLVYPIGAAWSARTHAGWTRREYDVTDGREAETDAPALGASLSLKATEGLVLTLAASHDVSDTIVFNRTEPEQEVFDSTDPLLSNLDDSYRELNVTRVGLNGNYRFPPDTTPTTLGAAVVYQRSEADSEEDLTQIAGQAGIEPAELEEDRVTMGLRIAHEVGAHVTVKGALQYGIAEDQTSTLYEFHAVSAGLNIHF